VLTAWPAITVALAVGVLFVAARRAGAGFSGVVGGLLVVARVHTAAGSVVFVDDYGHHPTEIAATLQAARAAWSGRRIVAVFQPHRYTRTKDLFDEFAQVLSACDALLLLPVYPAGEEPIGGADSKSLARAIRARGAVEPVLVEELDELPEVLGNILRADDVVLTLGAGSIGSAAIALPEALRAQRPVGVKA
jgi:UDP-N-acetylmuramate--alanine ligase